MQNLTTTAEFDALLEAPTALVYKHSTRCPISAMAYEQIGELNRTRPDAPIYMVDVHAGRDVSDYISKKLGITHHSPQAVLLRDGKAVWHAEHFDIKAPAMARQLGDDE
jgi:bacillithiol system protein YtxJ